MNFLGRKPLGTYKLVAPYPLVLPYLVAKKGYEMNYARDILAISPKPNQLLPKAWGGKWCKKLDILLGLKAYIYTQETTPWMIDIRKLALGYAIWPTDDIVSGYNASFRDEFEEQLKEVAPLK